MGAKVTRLPEGVSAEDFVRAWQDNDSVRAVAKSCRMSPLDASGLASYLRSKHGVPLKHFRRQVPTFDAAALRAVALEYEPS